MKKIFANGTFIRPFNKLICGAQFAFAWGVLLVLFPFAAQAQTLGEMMCSVSNNIQPFRMIFVGIAYIGGALMLGTGFFQLAFYTDVMNQGRQYGISRPKGYLVAGAAMLALPSFLSYMMNSIGLSGAGIGGNGLSATGCYAPVAAGGGDGLDGLMRNLTTNIAGPIVHLFSVISFLSGIYMVIRGLIKGSKFGQDAKATVGTIAANIVIGTILFTIGSSLDTIMATVFGDGNISGSGSVVSFIGYNFGAGTGPFQDGVTAALAFVQMIGMIAFIRGWLILKDAVEGLGQKTVAQGLTHILGGVLAINIYRFLDVMDWTFGTNFFSS
jgi:hypothetical protein